MDKYLTMPIQKALIRLRATGDYAHFHYLHGYAQALLLSGNMTSLQWKMCCNLSNSALSYGQDDKDEREEIEG